MNTLRECSINQKKAEITRRECRFSGYQTRWLVHSLRWLANMKLSDACHASDEWYKYTKRVCIRAQEVYKYIYALLT